MKQITPRIDAIIAAIPRIPKGSSPRDESLRTGFKAETSPQIALDCFKRLKPLEAYIFSVREGGSFSIFCGKPCSSWTDLEICLWRQFTGIEAAVDKVPTDPAELTPTTINAWSTASREATNLLSREEAILAASDDEALLTLLADKPRESWSPWWVTLWLEAVDLQRYGDAFMGAGITGGDLTNPIKVEPIIQVADDLQRLQNALGSQ